ncbi:hypothetical protein MRB53_030543 [Persea americana]|uniref:Uncharacterized protein n=1 Tax=Persea americana TaxID=3435 RepID=A0ACC2KLJ0_PERAE|nr:hypothetical protein MRB53_030543 [Persea americana]
MSSSGNKAWMNKHRLSPEYLDGIVHFLEFTKKHGGGFKHFPCPCAKCRNGSGMIALNMIHEHLLINGIDESYTHWILHGECVATTNEKTTRSNHNEQPNNMYPRMEELVNDAFGRIGENVDALMDDLIRNRDIHESSQEFQGEDEGEERRYKWVLDSYQGIAEWHMKYKTYLSTTTPKGPKKKGVVSKNIEHDFINWLRQEMESVEGEPILKRLAVGPMFKAKCYNKYRSSMLPKQRMVITLNAHGLPVGDNSTKLSSRCGQLVRSIVPISYKDWHAVPNEKKVELWKLLLV